MALTAHKTLTVFMKYVHTEDDPVRAAAAGAAWRPTAEPACNAHAGAGSGCPSVAPEVEVIEPVSTGTGKPLGYEDGQYSSRTKLGNDRPFRHRSGENRPIPPGTKRDEKEASHA